MRSSGWTCPMGTDVLLASSWCCCCGCAALVGRGGEDGASGSGSSGPAFAAAAAAVGEKQDSRLARPTPSSGRGRDVPIRGRERSCRALLLLCLDSSSDDDIGVDAVL
jgi:hypothetical protein